MCTSHHAHVRAHVDARARALRARAARQVRGRIEAPHGDTYEGQLAEGVKRGQHFTATLKRDAARLKMVELFGDVISARRRQTPEQAAARTCVPTDVVPRGTS